MAASRLTIAVVGRRTSSGWPGMHPGPGTLAATLAQGLRQLADRDELVIDNPLPAASDFSWLVISTPQKMVMFGAAGTVTTAGVEEFVTSAVKVVLAAYRP